MANDEYYGTKKASSSSSSSSSSSVCEASMLLVSNIIRLSCHSLFGAQSFPPNYRNNDPPPSQDHHERLAKVSLKPSAASKIKITQESADSVMVTKPRSYLVKPGQVGQTLTRQETNDDVDVHAGNYINQVHKAKIKITQESADSVMVTKPGSYLVKPGQVGQTLTRQETNDDVDVHAGNYINQVRERINGNHVNQ